MLPRPYNWSKRFWSWRISAVPACLLDVNVWVAAAFAISSSTRMVTLDQDFLQFLGAGPDLELLQADGHGGG